MPSENEISSIRDFWCSVISVGVGRAAAAMMIRNGKTAPMIPLGARHAARLLRDESPAEPAWHPAAAGSGRIRGLRAGGLDPLVVEAAIEQRR